MVFRHGSVMLGSVMLGLALGLVAGGVACDEQKPTKKTKAASPKDPGWVLESRVMKERKFTKYIRRGLAWAMIAEVQRGNRRAAIFYPALMKGKLIDNDIVAYVYEKTDQGWKRVGGSFGVHRKDGKQTLNDRLGGSGKLEVIRPCGLPKADLAGHVKRWGEAFFARHKAGDDRGAMQAYAALIRAFAFDLVAHDTILQHWLALGIARPGIWPRVTDVKGEQARLEITHQGQTIGVPMRLARCGQGWVLSRPQGFVPR